MNMTGKRATATSPLSLPAFMATVGAWRMYKALACATYLRSPGTGRRGAGGARRHHTRHRRVTAKTYTSWRAAAYAEGCGARGGSSAGSHLQYMPVRRGWASTASPYPPW